MGALKLMVPQRLAIAALLMAFVSLPALAHVEESDVIDMISTNAQKTEVIVAMVQHLGWDERTNGLIERKLRTYLAFIESGDLRRRYPHTAGMAVSIEIAYLQNPSPTALEYIELVERRLRARGILLRTLKLEHKK